MRRHDCEKPWGVGQSARHSFKSLCGDLRPHADSVDNWRKAEYSGTLLPIRRVDNADRPAVGAVDTERTSVELSRSRHRNRSCKTKPPFVETNDRIPCNSLFPRIRSNAVHCVGRPPNLPELSPIFVPRYADKD
jgi:hypothetical protein